MSQLTSLTSIHTSFLETLIAVMMVARKIPVSHNSEVVYKPMMSYCCGIFNARVECQDAQYPLLCRPEDNKLYLFYFLFSLFSAGAACPSQISHCYLTWCDC